MHVQLEVSPLDGLPLLLDTSPHLDKLSPLRSSAHRKTTPAALPNLIWEFARHVQEPGHGVAWLPVLESGSSGEWDASRWDRPTCYTLLALRDSRSNRFCWQVKSLLLPLSWCFCRIFLSLPLFLFSLVVADGKGCEARKQSPRNQHRSCWSDAPANSSRFCQQAALGSKTCS